MDLKRLQELAGIEGQPLTESATVNESAPKDEEDFVKKAKRDFKKRYGKRWKEVLYATAWKHHNKKVKEDFDATADGIFELLELLENEQDKIAEAFETSDTTYLVYSRKARKAFKVQAKNMYDAVTKVAGTKVEKLSGNPVLSSPSNPVKFISDDGEAREFVSYQLDDEPAPAVQEGLVSEAEKPHDSEFPKVKFLGDKGPANELKMTEVEFNDDKLEYNKVMTGADVEENTKVDVPAYVVRAIDKRIKELKDSIETYNEKGYSDEGQIYEDPKHTALDILEKFKEHLSKKNVEEYKMAQVLYGTLMSPILDLLPSQLINFLHNGKDEPKKKI